VYEVCRTAPSCPSRPSSLSSRSPSDGNIERDAAGGLTERGVRETFGTGEQQHRCLYSEGVRCRTEKRVVIPSASHRAVFCHPQQKKHWRACAGKFIPSHYSVLALSLALHISEDGCVWSPSQTMRVPPLAFACHVGFCLRSRGSATLVKDEHTP
jgi:hypothetical protein